MTAFIYLTRRELLKQPSTKHSLFLGFPAPLYTEVPHPCISLFSHVIQPGCSAWQPPDKRVPVSGKTEFCLRSDDSLIYLILINLLWSVLNSTDPAKVHGRWKLQHYCEVATQAAIGHSTIFFVNSKLYVHFRRQIALQESSSTGTRSLARERR